MVPDFQSYLESIRATYDKWWELYTLTDAAGRQQQAQEVAPTFDFGLMVRTVKREERGERRQEEKIERLPVLEGIRKYADQQVLLVGRPGSGKSTALARLMLEEAAKPQARIPVLVELRYWQGSIEQLIRDSLTRHGLRVEQLEMVLEQSLILFDGVNELPAEEARSQLSAFRRNHPKLPMIFTTRDLSLGGDLGIEKKLEMQPLTEPQMRDFIRAYVPEQAEQMLRQLKDRLREFGQTPLLLWMLCEVIQQSPDSTPPKNLGEIFRVSTEAYEQSSVRKHEVAALKGDVKPLSDRRLWKKALKALAFLMMQGETPVDFRVVIHRDEAERELSRIFPNEPFPVRDLLDDLLKYHLLQTRSADQIEFRHQLLQEYYAAEALLGSLEEFDLEEGKQFKREFLNFLKWTEPISLMLALADETQVVQVVELALETDLILGARLAGKASLDLQEKTVKLVTLIECEIWLKFLLLGETRSDIVIHELIAALKHSNVDVRRGAASALGKIRSEAAIPHLLKLLKHSHIHIRRRAISALGKIDSEEAITILIQSLDRSSSGLRRRAASALGELGSEEAIPTLLKILEDPSSSSSLLKSVASALGNIRSEVSIPSLIKILENQDLETSVRVSAASALGRIGSEVAIPNLRKALKDPESSIRRSAAKSLFELEPNTADPALLTAAHHSNLPTPECPNTKPTQIADTSAISQLLELSENSDWRLRWDATYTLTQIDSNAALPLLLKALSEPKSSMRWRVKKALARFKCDSAAHILPDLLKLLPTQFGKDAIQVLQSIQIKCEFYNYEIYQAYLEAQEIDRQTPQNNGSFASRSVRSIHYHIGQAGIINTGNVTIQGDQNGEQPL